jgi:hypothetical protein
MKVTIELNEMEISQAVREYLMKNGHVKAGCTVAVSLVRVEIPPAAAKVIARADISESRGDYFDR